MNEYHHQEADHRTIDDLTDEEREFALERYLHEESLNDEEFEASIRESTIATSLPFDEQAKFNQNDPVAVQKAYVG